MRAWLTGVLVVCWAAPVWAGRLAVGCVADQLTPAGKIQAPLVVAYVTPPGYPLANAKADVASLPLCGGRPLIVKDEDQWPESAKSNPVIVREKQARTEARAALKSGTPLTDEQVDAFLAR